MNSSVRRAKCNFSLNFRSTHSLPSSLCTVPFTTRVYKNRLITFSSTFNTAWSTFRRKSIFNCTLYFLLRLEQFFDLFPGAHRAFTPPHTQGVPAPWQNRKLNSASHAVPNHRLWKLNSACFGWFLPSQLPHYSQSFSRKPKKNLNRI